VPLSGLNVVQLTLKLIRNYHGILDNGLKKIQVLCAVMRKFLLSIHAMFRTQKPFNSYIYQITQQLTEDGYDVIYSEKHPLWHTNQLLSGVSPRQ